MRTTLSLDDDVSVLVERRQSASKQSLKAVINEALRKGLAVPGPAGAPSEFSSPSYNLGVPLYTNLDNLAEVLAVAEKDGFS